MKPVLALLFSLIASFGNAQVSHLSKLDAYMQAQADVNHFAGTVLVTRNDSVLLEKAYGPADREWLIPNTTDTKFCLASITKHFTALAILQLVEQGKLTTQSKLQEFFAEYPKGDSVTIHMLLTHTSGLDLDFEELYLEHTSISRDSALAVIMRKPYLYSPGTACAYSNIGYFLLGMIIEQVSGLSYEEYMKQFIFGPAGMSDSGVSNNDSIISRMARVYYRTETGYSKNPYINWELNRGHDGIYSTAGDLRKLDAALSNGTLLSEASIRKMTTPSNKAFPDGGFFEQYGYGIFVNPYYNHGHFLLTHSGGYFGVMTTFDRYPDDDLFITVLSNNESESHWISYGLAAIVFGIPVELPRLHTAIAYNEKLLARCVGNYGELHFMLIDGKFCLNSEATILLQESATTFFRADNPDRVYEFLADKKGKVTAVSCTKGGVSQTTARTQ